MAKVIFNEPAIDLISRHYLIKKLSKALLDYRTYPLERDKPGYPFAQKEGESSIRDPQSSSLTVIPGGIRVTVESEGAAFAEFGNKGSGDTIEGDPLKIQLKPGKRLGKVQIIGGKAFFVTKSVEAYDGKHYLRNAIRRAFNIIGV